MKVSALILLIVIAVIFLPDLVFLWSNQFFWYDTLLHFLGGAFLGFLFLGYFSKTNLFVFLGGLLLVGLLWEGFEVLLDLYILEKRLPAFYFWDGFLDTAADLFFDLIGGLTVWLGYAFFRQRR